MKNYEILNPVYHKGKKRTIGDIIELEDSEAKPLLSLGYIAHNGKRYAADDTVEMSEANGEPLVELRYLEPLIDQRDEKLPSDDTEKTNPVDGDETVALIVATFVNEFNGVAPEKKPNVEDVRAWCDSDAITVKQRDEAWKLYLAMPSEGDSAADSDEA